MAIYYNKFWSFEFPTKWFTESTKTIRKIKWKLKNEIYKSNGQIVFYFIPLCIERFFIDPQSYSRVLIWFNCSKLNFLQVICCGIQRVRIYCNKLPSIWINIFSPTKVLSSLEFDYANIHMSKKWFFFQTHKNTEDL